jgi:UDP-N-acetylglucosamine:LPS N-acetylglucosamine transferase
VNLTFVISSNGFGHLKRVTSVLHLILEYNKKLNIFIVCNDIKKRIIKRDKSLKNLRFCTSIMKYEINWLSPEKNALNQYLKWKNNFENSTVIKKSDLIVSDNLVIPIFSNKKVILMGSFLWHDIIDTINPTFQKIAEAEKNILLLKKPKIVCLESMYMNSISKYTNTVKVPWFTNRIKVKRFHKNKEVLITGGGTEQLDEILLSIANKIYYNSSLKIFLDEKLYNKYKKYNTINSLFFFQFDFKEQSFGSLTTIICRPGIGILTECVKYSIPVIAVYDNSNKEISHNAKKITALKIGSSIHIKNNFVSGYYVKKIKNIINSRTILTKYKKEILKQDINGAEKATNLILKELNL